MAELETNEAIVHTPPLSKEAKEYIGMGGSDMVTVKDYNAAGQVSEITIPLPKSADFKTWTLMQQAVMLKRGVWRTCSVPDIVWGMAYANSIGADVMKGELFPTGDGRWGTSNKYKLRKALETGRIEGIEVSFKELQGTIDLPGCIRKTDLECTVTITVKGFVKPLVRTAKLSRWYKASNPNWKGNPEHMLELNTVAHACEYILPGATEDDEAPPIYDDVLVGQAINTPKF